MAADQAKRSVDGGQGCAQFVADDRDEFALQIFGLFALDGMLHRTGQGGDTGAVFQQVVLGAVFHGARLDLGVFQAGQHDHGQPGRDIQYGVQAAEAQAIGQTQIQKHHVEVLGFQRL